MAVDIAVAVAVAVDDIVMLVHLMELVLLGYFAFFVLASEIEGIAHTLPFCAAVLVARTSVALVGASADPIFVVLVSVSLIPVAASLAPVFVAPADRAAVVV